MAKSWSQRLLINGKPFNIGLGSYPVITLARARELVLQNRQAVAEGNAPWTPPDAVPTFAEAVDTVIAERSTSWKSSKPRNGGGPEWTPTPFPPWEKSW
ncbi:MAG: Arm DNA-binding domain-containing protein [Chloroflexota bacterium]|nr:Arm DNA-binding domain-containing protein [Chloroflexota bacterium]